MTRVLVTGATGFLGRPAVHALRDRGLVVEEAGSRRADLLAPGAPAALIRETRPTHLLHLAWYARPGLFWDAAENAAWVHATLALVEAFAAAGGRRAVLAGTCAEYAWGAEGALREDGPTSEPGSFYGVCKDATRRVAEGLCLRRGVSFAWGRVFFLYGPREHPDRLIASVVRKLLRGERIATTDGTQVRDFLHVGDVGDAFAALLASDVEGAVNVASGCGVRVRDVLCEVGAATGRADLIDIGGLPQRPGDPPVIVADAARLREEVGWLPRFDLSAGIADAVEWWRREGGQ